MIHQRLLQLQPLLLQLLVLITQNWSPRRTCRSRYAYHLSICARVRWLQSLAKAAPPRQQQRHKQHNSTARHFSDIRARLTTTTSISHKHITQNHSQHNHNHHTRRPNNTSASHSTDPFLAPLATCEGTRCPPTHQHARPLPSVLDIRSFTLASHTTSQQHRRTQQRTQRHHPAGHHRPAPCSIAGQ